MTDDRFVLICQYVLAVTATIWLLFLGVIHY